MPVTLTTASHPSNKWRYPKVSNVEDWFKQSCPHEHEKSQKLFQHSFPPNFFDGSHISKSDNGFVWAVFHAYINHHHLTIRPEDVWFSILSQLNFFINAHAEELRHSFVEHEGQKELKVTSSGTIMTADIGGLAVQLTRQIEENVIDKELRAWIMPDFTTTTKSDTVIAAILMMGAMQKYFSYSMMLLCGIPSVTMLGEREDWVKLVNKLDKLQQLGDEPARFGQLLRPILNNFVACFDNPESTESVDFWSKCADKHSMGSGPSYLSGWISVFCFWDKEGQTLHREEFHPKDTPEFQSRNTETELDDVLSRRVDIADVPAGFASVPVAVDDNGVLYETMMVAGSIGIQATSSATKTHNDSSLPSAQSTELDSVQPLSGWCMYEKQPAQ
ncbi:hypothetical protein N7456_011206 [Penicillium angulare]|uniref:Uncharacterized protein n=1 Tax=Penicillium angulare TaxID=116970 RepID=A0A9W9ETK4_9EURO|nr:hypothetical protein N7456_011206 [Penicillium angulare]